MDFCTAHFGKSLSTLTVADVKSFFLEERIETDQIEFKSISTTGNLNDKFVSIQKAVCAFLNSSGGLIIWGAPQGQIIKGRKEKMFKGDLTFFNQIVEKDFTVSKISDSIIPLPLNIRINILSEENKSLMVIEVDASDYSPHQNDNTYYMRIDGQSKPAPHHYIEALFKKITYPHIEAFLQVTNLGLFQSNKYKVDLNIFLFNWSPLQNEENLSFRVTSDGVFLGSELPQNRYSYRLEGHEFIKTNAKDIFSYGEPFYERLMLLFDPYKLELVGKMGKVIIMFGGKFSPRKIGEYRLDLSNVYVENPSKILIVQNENRLVNDLHDEKGITKESIIKDTFKVFTS